MNNSTGRQSCEHSTNILYTKDWQSQAAGGRTNIFEGCGYISFLWVEEYP